jgi:hypothetical protein
MKIALSTGALVAVSLFTFAACSTQDDKPQPAATPAPAAAKAAEAKTPAAKTTAEAKTSEGKTSEAKSSEAKSSDEKAPEKAKATKLAGDVGLLDTEKNYMILVTKEGKLVTIDYDAKYQPTQKEYVPAKVADIGLGSAATVQYTKEGEKSIASNIEFLPAKGE